MTASDTKECKLCGCTIERGKRPKFRWERIRFCTPQCVGFYRGELISGWRDDKKECIVCRVSFGPREDMTKGEWRRIKCCCKSCTRKAQTGRKPVREQRQPKYRFQRIKMDPMECRTAGRRLRFLRLSRSPEGTKNPITADDMATLARMRYETLQLIESDSPTMSRRSVEKVCAALKIPMDMLTWSDKKWTRVITKIGLTATELVKIKPNTNESN